MIMFLVNGFVPHMPTKIGRGSADMTCDAEKTAALDAKSILFLELRVPTSKLK